MQTIWAVLAFLAAAFVGRLVGRSQIAKCLDNHRWLRVGAFALAFLLVAAILTGGDH
jgi:fucose permease